MVGDSKEAPVGDMSSPLIHDDYSLAYDIFHGDRQSDKTKEEKEAGLEQTHAITSYELTPELASRDFWLTLGGTIFKVGLLALAMSSTYYSVSFMKGKDSSSATKNAPGFFNEIAYYFLPRIVQPLFGKILDFNSVGTAYGSLAFANNLGLNGTFAFLGMLELSGLLWEFVRQKGRFDRSKGVTGKYAFNLLSLAVSLATAIAMSILVFHLDEDSLIPKYDYFGLFCSNLPLFFFFGFSVMNLMGIKLYNFTLGDAEDRFLRDIYTRRAKQLMIAVNQMPSESFRSSQALQPLKILLRKYHRNGDDARAKQLLEAHIQKEILYLTGQRRTGCPQIITGIVTSKQVRDKFIETVLRPALPVYIDTASGNKVSQLVAEATGDDAREQYDYENTTGKWSIQRLSAAFSAWRFISGFVGILGYYQVEDNKAWAGLAIFSVGCIAAKTNVDMRERSSFTDLVNSTLAAGTLYPILGGLLAKMFGLKLYATREISAVLSLLAFVASLATLNPIQQYRAPGFFSTQNKEDESVADDCAGSKLTVIAVLKAVKEILVFVNFVTAFYSAATNVNFMSAFTKINVLGAPDAKFDFSQEGLQDPSQSLSLGLIVAATNSATFSNGYGNLELVVMGLNLLTAIVSWALERSCCYGETASDSTEHSMLTNMIKQQAGNFETAQYDTLAELRSAGSDNTDTDGYRPVMSA